jgi:hypothetical protein
LPSFPEELGRKALESLEKAREAFRKEDWSAKRRSCSGSFQNNQETDFHWSVCKKGRS